MKFVIHSSIAARWYLPDQITNRGLSLRTDFFFRVHELITLDLFVIESSQMLSEAEKSKKISAGMMQAEILDLQAMGIPLFPSIPLLSRAGEISLATKLTVFSGLYVALENGNDAHFSRPTRS